MKVLGSKFVEEHAKKVKKAFAEVARRHEEISVLQDADSAEGALQEAEGSNKSPTASSEEEASTPTRSSEATSLESAEPSQEMFDKMPASDFSMNNVSAHVHVIQEIKFDDVTSLFSILRQK